MTMTVIAVVAVMLMGMWIAIMRVPETPIARALWWFAVVLPEAWIRRVWRRHGLTVLAVGAIVAIITAWLGHEGVQLLAMVAPEAGTWLMSVEVGTLFETLTVIAMASSVARLRVVRSRCSIILARCRRRRGARARRSPVCRRPHRPAANDDDRPAWARAA